MVQMLSCKMPYISIDGRNCAIVKKQAPLPPPHRKKRRFFTKYHFLKGSKCSVFGFGLSLVFSHFASCDKFVISCKSCKTRVVCFCFGHSLNPLFLLWSDFREVLNVLLILGILTSEMVQQYPQLFYCYYYRFLTNRTCRYSCLYWLARLP